MKYVVYGLSYVYIIRHIYNYIVVILEYREVCMIL